MWYSPDSKIAIIGQTHIILFFFTAVQTGGPNSCTSLRFWTRNPAVTWHSHATVKWPVQEHGHVDEEYKMIGAFNINCIKHTFKFTQWPILERFLSIQWHSSVASQSKIVAVNYMQLTYFNIDDKNGEVIVNTQNVSAEKYWERMEIKNWAYFNTVPGHLNYRAYILSPENKLYE